MDPRRALESLLLSLFAVDELRRFVRYLPEGGRLEAALPGPTAPPIQVAYAAVDLFVREGIIGADLLWEALVKARPRRAAEIRQVQACFEVTAKPQSPDPVSLRILLVSASPSSERRLRVDREHREITARIRGARHRDRVDVEPLSAARFEDLRTALMQHKPHVLHLSCHGEEDGSLVLESSTGEGSRIIPPRNLLMLLRAVGDELRLVVVNACHAVAVAREIPTIGALSVGIREAIHDDEAIDFSVAFYEALAFGQPVEAAFEAALAGLVVDGDLPELFPPAGEDPEGRRRAPLIT
ncbi:MAG: CHAT domain-containing protein [Myxococcales bacterium]|nr:CHAT domain-containing protein [Myxococcales bacterium]MCB9706711.1 CHAT domain-containing protein [Myxococcales bacterium]